jgi:hypothetical protein
MKTMLSELKEKSEAAQSYKEESENEENASIGFFTTRHKRPSSLDFANLKEISAERRLNNSR